MASHQICRHTWFGSTAALWSAIQSKIICRLSCRIEPDQADIDYFGFGNVSSAADCVPLWPADRMFPIRLEKKLRHISLADADAIHEAIVTAALTAMAIRTVLKKNDTTECAITVRRISVL